MFTITEDIAFLLFDEQCNKEELISAQKLENRNLTPSCGQKEKCGDARTGMMGTFFREVSTGLLLDSGSSLTLSFSLLSSTGESR